MKHKGGYTYGSIYERRRAGKELSYTAEIQFQGQKIRRSSKDKDLLDEWLRTVCEELNAVIDRYNDQLSIELQKIKNRLYADMVEQARPIISKAKAYDLRYRECADVMGLSKTDGFQTYIIRDEETGLVKIGKSKDIYIRMRILRTTVADIELLAYVDKDIESKLHAEYKAKRVKGEWFKLTGEDVEKIISEHGFKGGGAVFRKGWA